MEASRRWGAGRWAAGRRTVDQPSPPGWGSKSVTVDKSSSQGGDRRERPWGVEVGSDFAKWPRAVVKAYILKLKGPRGAGRWR